ncbi:MAG: TonB-dependent receptor [Pseudomonadota bacterium]|nr:TonB-dependent receptor [Pseudomonadota bacterium]
MAQSSGTKAAPLLDPVVVTATRTADDPLSVPAAVDVIRARELHRAQPLINLSESLQRIPGVVARDRQNHAQDLQISIRGFGARSTFGVRGVRLYTDGIPATMPDGQGQVSHFSLDSADRIEVLRGPFSALYGNGSGGVIELFSADPPSWHEIEAGHVAGSYGLHKSILSLRGPLSAGGPGFRLDAATMDTDGYREHSAAQLDTAQFSLKGTAGDTRYFLLLNALDLKAEDPQGLTAAELDGDRRAASPASVLFDSRKTVRQDQVGARVEHDLTSSQRVLLTGYRGNRKTMQVLTVPVFVQASPTSGGGVIDLDRDYHGIDARWQWSLGGPASPVTLTAGAQHEVSDEARLGFENFIGDRVGIVGALRRYEQNRVSSFDQYLQLDWKPHEQWRINAGVRRSEVRFTSDDRYIAPGNPDDSGRLSFSRTSPVIGVLYRASPTLSLYANLGEGFETPTSAELAYRDDGLSKFNDRLKPARSTNHEIGLRGRTESQRYSAALFHSRTEDELVVVSNRGGRSVFGNAGLSRRRGAELALQGMLSQGWDYALSYTFLDARYLRDFAVCASPPCLQSDLLIEAGRQIPGLSRHMAWGEIRWKPIEGFDLALESRVVDRVFASDSNDAAAPGYALFDLSAERRMEIAGLQWRAFARLNNLFDRDVIGSVIVNQGNGRFFEPHPGRNWTVGLYATRAFGESPR